VGNGMKKNNDILNMKNATSDEISAKVLELRRELMKNRFSLFSGQLKNTSVMKNIRRDIARLLTYLRLNDLKSNKGE